MTNGTKPTAPIAGEAGEPCGGMAAGSACRVFWLLAFFFALLSLAMLFQHGALGLIPCLVTGLICFLALLLRGKVHDALAVYELTSQGVSKRSPFGSSEPIGQRWWDGRSLKVTASGGC